MISLRKLVNSFTYAFEGLNFAFRVDQNLRIHIVAAVIVVVLGFYFHVTRDEMLLLLTMIVLVFAAEMINTAIEKMVDLITMERRANAKIAKDVSSAMVLIVSMGATIVGIAIFLPYVGKFIS